MVAKVYGRFNNPTLRSVTGGSVWLMCAVARNGPVVVGSVAKERETVRTNMKKPPQALIPARVTMIAGAGLEPATPAL